MYNKVNSALSKYQVSKLKRAFKNGEDVTNGSTTFVPIQRVVYDSASKI